MGSVYAAIAGVTNTAKAIGDYNNEKVESGTSSQTIPVASPAPDMTLAYSGKLEDDDGVTGLSAGDTISYTLVVTNTGNLSLTNVSVDDSLVALALEPGSDANGNDLLDLSETWTYKADYTITVNDLATNGLQTGESEADGEIDSVVTVSADEMSDKTASEAIEIEPTADMLVANVGTYVDDDGIPGLSAGDHIVYNITVTNNGQLNLSNVAASGALTQGSTPADLTTVFDATSDINTDGLISPGEVFKYTMSYEITQADIDAGSDLVTSVSVTSDETDGAGENKGVDTFEFDTNTLVSSYTMVSAAALVDANSNELGDLGETVDYTFTFENTGNATLTNLKALATVAGLSTITCAGDVDSDGDIDSLAPGATAECTASLVITASHVALGQIDNVATSTATAADGTTAVNETGGTDDNNTSIPTATTYQLVVDAGSSLNDTDGVTGPSVGDTITNTVSVSNPGTGNLTGIDIDESYSLQAGGDANGNGIMEPGETWIYTAEHTLTEDDFTENSEGERVYENTVSVDSSVTEPVTKTASVSLESNGEFIVSSSGTLNDNDGVTGTSAGDTIDYVIKVENTGEDDLTSVEVAGNLAQGASSQTLTPVLVAGSDANGDGVLNAGETWLYNLSYTLTNDDINDGSALSYTASVDTFEEDAQSGEPYELALEGIIDSYDLVVTNELQDGDGDGKGDLGEEVGFTFTFTNTGSRDLSDLTALSSLEGMSNLICTPDADGDGKIDTLAVGQTASCTASYALTQEDLDAGEVENTVTASAQTATGGSLAPGETSGNGSGSIELPLDTQFAYTMVSAVALVDANSNDLGDLGETVDYTFTFENTGNATLTNLKALATVAGLSTITCAGDVDSDGDIDSLAPGATAECTASLVITASHVALGQIDNVATSTATAADGTTAVNETGGTDDNNTSIPTATTYQLVVDAGSSLNDTDGVTGPSVGDTITNTVSVSNPGTGNLTGIDIDESYSLQAGGDANGNGIMEPGETWIYTAEHTLTEDDFTENSEGERVYENTVSVDSSVTEPVTKTASVSLESNGEFIVSSSGTLNDNDGVTGTSAGDTIDYVIKVENTGEDDLTSVEVAGNLAQGASSQTLTPVLVAGSDANGDGVLNAGETWLYNLSYTLTNDDINDGSALSYTASVDTFEEDAQSGEPYELALEGIIDSYDLVVTNELQDGDGDGKGDLGEEVGFTFTFTNTGSRDLSDLTALSSLEGMSNLICTPDADGDGKIDTLAVGQTASCTASYALTQEDLDAGEVENTVTASAQTATGGSLAPGETSGNGSGSIELPLDTQFAYTMVSAVALVDANSNDLGDLGETVDYTFTFENTGNATLTNLKALATVAGLSTITCAGDADSDGDIDSLAPGATAECTASLEITSSHVALGQIDNVATSTATAADGTTAVNETGGTDDNNTSIPTATTYQLVVDAGSSLNDTDGVTGPSVGDTITNTVSVSNPGTGNLTGIDIDESYSLQAGGDANGNGIMEPGETWIYTAEHTLTEDDFTENSEGERVYENTVSVDSSVTEPVTKTASVSLESNGEFIVSSSGTLNDNDGVTGTSAGDTIDYVIKVENTGEDDLTSVEVAGNLAQGASSQTLTPVLVAGSDANGDGVLNAGETWLYNLSYTLTNDDINDGSALSYTASVDTFEEDAQSGEPYELALEGIIDSYDLVVTNELQDGDGDGKGDLGEEVGFTFTFTNTGSRDLSDLTALSSLEGMSNLICTPDADGDGKIDTLAVGQTASCTASYALTQEDLDAGEVENTVTASAQTATGGSLAPGETSGNGSGSIELPLDTQFAYTMVSAVALVDANSNDLGDLGETVDYTFTFENTGNATLTNLKALATVAGLSTITCAGDVDSDGDIDSLAPGATAECTASLVITASHVALGQIDNVATSTATAADGTTAVNETGGTDDNNTSIPTATTYQLVVDAGSSLNDTDGVTGPSVGDTITNTVSVSNPGTGNLTGIDIDESYSLQAGGDANGNGIMEPGETWIYTAEHTLTEDDFTENSEGERVYENTVSVDSSVTEPVTKTASVSLESNGEFIVSSSGTLNDNDGVTGTSAGDTIDYVIKVENTGEDDLTSVEVAGNLAQGASSQTLTPVLVAGSDANGDGVLNAGETWLYNLSYTLTNDDINDGSALSYTASVDTFEEDAQSGEPYELALEGIIDSYDLVVTNELQDGDGDGKGDLGEEVGFTFTFTNTGSRDLSDLTALSSLEGMSNLICTPDADGDGKIDTLAVGQTASCTASYALTQEDLDAGEVENTVTASAQTATGGSLAPGETSGNGSGSIELPLDTQFALALEKTLSKMETPFPNIYELEYTLHLENKGSVTLTNLSLIDNIQDAIDAPAYIDGVVTVINVAGEISQSDINSAYDGKTQTQVLASGLSLGAGEEGSVTLRVRVDRLADDLKISNQAIANSDQIDEAVHSDDPTVTPGDASDTNPTVIAMLDTDKDGVTDDMESSSGDKDGDGVPNYQDYDPTGYLYCEEDGRILKGGKITVHNLTSGGSRSDVGISNNIDIRRDGSDGFFQFYVTAAGRYSISFTPPAGGAVKSEVRLSLGVMDVKSFLPTNPVVLGSSEVGNSDELQDFTAASNPFYTEFEIAEGSPAVFNNNIPFKMCGTSSLEPNLSMVGQPVVQSDGSTQVTYRLEVENTGTVELDDITFENNLASVFGTDYEINSISMALAPDNSGFATNASYDGESNISLLTSGNTLQAGESVALLLDVTISAPQGNYINTLTVNATNPFDSTQVGEKTAELALTHLGLGGLEDVVALKTTPVVAAPLGSVVPYTITINNNSAFDLTDVEVVDFVPQGFSYVKNSAQVNGAASEPAISNARELVWPKQNLAAGNSITTTLSLVMGANASGTEFINSAFLRSAVTGETITNVAKVSIELEVESVFQCSQIIGRVFDDLDKDGYYDKGEPGLGGVRVVSVNGLLITTDQFGRYHVACDQIPADRIGSNYILKLDERTLPTGYQVTSENPRVVRATRGKLVKLNFAAANLRVVSVELKDSSFKQGSTSLSRDAIRDIARILPILEEETSILKINYVTDVHVSREHKKKLKAVKDLVLKAWNARKRDYRLKVDTKVRGN